MADLRAEWLEADGLGGFSSGTVGGIRTRRYHAWLLTAMTPPTGRMVLVNGAEVHVSTPGGHFPLSTQLYSPDVVHPDGQHFLHEFKVEPWPTWTFRLPDGTVISQELFVPHDSTGCVVRWRLVSGSTETKISVRPLMSGRDYHCMHHANSSFGFEAQVQSTGPSECRCEWSPYSGLPQIVALTNGTYRHEPLWFYRFRYEVEAERGLDCEEDLASPGVWEWDLGEKPAGLVLTTDGTHSLKQPHQTSVLDWIDDLATREFKRRQALERIEPSRGTAVTSGTSVSLDKSDHSTTLSKLHRSADSYIVQRGTGKTIIAGYPWFTDWGRDTFIALRGLCLTTGRLDDARRILVDWSSTVSEGMLPNRFPDYGTEPEFNSVDASLWYVIAVSEFLQHAEHAGYDFDFAERARLLTAIKEILLGYSQGTRFNIRATSDGLLQAGTPGVQLTWMDAKVGNWVVTPRIGKPVEIQALWLNALLIGAQLLQAEHWQRLFEVGQASFRERFWNPATNGLFDVVDVDQVLGQNDASIRPNQLLAVGGLPLCLLSDDAARKVVDQCELLLLTPLGLRTLAREDVNYHGRFTGSIHDRDGAYHQGTVWPWLMGPFVDAWLRVRHRTVAAKAEARQRFIAPLLQHQSEAGLGHVSEVADGDAPHTPRGCPFQAWSLGELLRAQAMCED